MLLTNPSTHRTLVLAALLGTSMFTRRLFTSATMMKKQLWIVRHGQAAHNPRAEAAKDAGCTHEEFMELMRQDDVLDAPTTDLGKSQARAVAEKHSWDHVELVVSSPLSRALETADLIVPAGRAKRVCMEHFREINGWLINAQRRNRIELQERFPEWDFGEIAPTDELWTPTLEGEFDCAHRGYQGLCGLLKRPEERILLVTHGGILRFLMNQHPSVVVVDGRLQSSKDREARARFGNCELRKYTLTSHGDEHKPTITLTEMD